MLPYSAACRFLSRVASDVEDSRQRPDKIICSSRRPPALRRMMTTRRSYSLHDHGLPVQSPTPSAPSPSLPKRRASCGTGGSAPYACLGRKGCLPNWSGCRPTPNCRLARGRQEIAGRACAPPGFRRPTEPARTADLGPFRPCWNELRQYRPAGRIVGQDLRRLVLGSPTVACPIRSRATCAIFGNLACEVAGRQPPHCRAAQSPAEEQAFAEALERVEQQVRSEPHPAE